MENYLVLKKINLPYKYKQTWKILYHKNFKF